MTARVDAIANVGVLEALGVERAEQEDGARRHDRSDLQGSSAETSTSAGPSKMAGERMARNTSVSSPALYVPWTTPVGMCAMSPAPSDRTSPSTHCSAVPEIT